MKFISIECCVVLACLFLYSCKSTDKELPQSNGVTVFPSMETLSDSDFLWNDEYSEALNVARLAFPAGVGNIYRDYDDGKDASIGTRVGGITKLFDVALGAYGSGIFGAVQMEALNNGIENAQEWKPTIVDIVDSSEFIEAGTNNKYSFRKVRDYVAKKIRTAIQQEHNNVAFGDTLSLKRSKAYYKDSLTQVIKGDVCWPLREFGTPSYKDVQLQRNNYSEHFYDGANVVEDYCSYSLELFITYELPNEQIAIVAAVRSGDYMNEALIKHYDGYVLVPDWYKASSTNVVENGYAFVAKNGEKLLFQKQSQVP